MAQSRGNAATRRNRHGAVLDPDRSRLDHHRQGRVARARSLDQLGPGPDAAGRVARDVAGDRATQACAGRRHLRRILAAAPRQLVQANRGADGPAGARRDGSAADRRQYAHRLRTGANPHRSLHHARRRMIDVTVHPSIDAIPAAEWDRLFPHELEDHAYLRAIERAGLAGFRYLYFAVRDEGRLLAAVPAFVTDYRLDTTMQGAMRHVVEALTKLFPRLFRIPMLSLGSPVTERCRVGYAPESSAEQRAAWLDAILAQMETVAAREKFGMLAVKDAPLEEPVWQQVCPRHGLRLLPGLPGATLEIPWHDLDGYLESLGTSSRKDLRRKRRAGSALRIEWRTSLDGIADDVQRLYRETLVHAEFSFEELTPAYFENVLRDMPGRALCVTYHEGDKLVAFNLVLRDAERLLDKFLGMDYAAMDRYNLYHVSWLENIRCCIDRHIGVYEAGQGLHREKLRLGCSLHANALWYHHRNRLVDGVFARFERLARMDRFDDLPVDPESSARRA
ncbi:MAG: GNAT family N-acetyltransferase [Rhodanobacteraceae bacterium]|nr:MAG: GNAT family N-acetyltransferase [Rhodanobacteraceae bacterium]